jgi:hypothetical protein
MADEILQHCFCLGVTGILHRRSSTLFDPYIVTLNSTSLVHPVCYVRRMFEYFCVLLLTAHCTLQTCFTAYSALHNTDMFYCLQRTAQYRHVLLLTAHCTIQTCFTAYSGLHNTDMFYCLQRTAQYRHVLLTAHCTVQTCFTAYSALHNTDMFYCLQRTAHIPRFRFVQLRLL